MKAMESVHAAAQHAADHRWESAGAPDGIDLEFWLQAEQARHALEARPDPAEAVEKEFISDE